MRRSGGSIDRGKTDPNAPKRFVFPSLFRMYACHPMRKRVIATSGKCSRCLVNETISDLVLRCGKTLGKLADTQK